MKRVEVEHNGTTYTATLMQYDAQTLTAHITNTETDRSTFIDIPVRVAPGFRWKCYAASIGCDSGNAADLVEFFEGWIGENCIAPTVRKVVFENAKNRRRVEELRPWC